MHGQPHIKVKIAVQQYKFELLLRDDGGRSPKHVGRYIICTYFTCFVCASCWVFSKNKYNVLLGTNSV